MGSRPEVVLLGECSTCGHREELVRRSLEHVGCMWWGLLVSGRIWSCLVVADRIPGSGVGTGMSTESEPKLALERERCVRVCEAK